MNNEHGPEEVWLEDPACGDAAAWADFRKDLKGPYKKLDRIVSMDKRASVVFEGVFHEPEPFDKSEIDPRLPAKADVVPTIGPFHIDRDVGIQHAVCAWFGVGCE